MPAVKRLMASVFCGAATDAKVSTAEWISWYCAAVPQFAVAVSILHGVNTQLMDEDGVVVECDGAGCVPMRAGSEMRFFRPWAPNAPSMTLEAPYRQPIVQKGGILNCCVDGFVTVGKWPGSGLQMS